MKVENEIKTQAKKEEYKLELENTEEVPSVPIELELMPENTI